MGWTRHDDRRPFTAKMAALSDAAYRLDDELIAWCSAQGTNGRITARLMPTISQRSARRKVVDELVKAQRLHRAGDAHCGHSRCPEPGPDGYSVHDYLDYNPTAEKEAKANAANAQRQADFRARNALRNGAGNASRDADVTPYVTTPLSFPPHTPPYLTPHPDPDPEVVGGGSNPAGTRVREVAPPSTCPDHPQGTDAPCGGCREARRSRELWDAEQAAGQRRRDAERRSAEAKARAEAAGYAIAACRLCDGAGYRNGRVCDHDPSTPDRAKRGAAAAREALGRPA